MFKLLNTSKVEEVTCENCGKASIEISKVLRVCRNCILKHPTKTSSYITQAHEKSRRHFGLPPKPPRAKDGVRCTLCGNKCIIPDPGLGFCGLRANSNGRLTHLAGTAKSGILEWYYDPIPTNCVGTWLCPGGTGVGYPRFANKKDGPEYGYKNLAVFYGACSFNCLFCQNWHYKMLTNRLSPVVTAQELADKVDNKTSCICFFGGDPSPQSMHAIKTSQLALEENKSRILRICWESNGSMSRSNLKKAAELSLASGGCFKVDLKTWHDELNLALCVVSNHQTLSNFEYLAGLIEERKEPPFLIASTLLIPGYVEKDEVKEIANFIASLDKEIPYSLLAFHPQFEMEDMPVTSKKQAVECLSAAKSVGLTNVRLGNIHLLE